MSSKTVDISGDVSIDMQSGAVTVLRINIVTNQANMTITLSNVADGVIVQYIIWNQSGAAQLFKIVGTDTGSLPLTVTLENSGGTILTISTSFVSLPSGVVRSAIGGLHYIAGVANLVLALI